MRHLIVVLLMGTLLLTAGCTKEKLLIIYPMVLDRVYSAPENAPIDVVVPPALSGATVRAKRVSYYRSQLYSLNRVELIGVLDQCMGVYHDELVETPDDRILEFYALFLKFSTHETASDFAKKQSDHLKRLFPEGKVLSFGFGIHYFFAIVGTEKVYVFRTYGDFGYYYEIPMLKGGSEETFTYALDVDKAIQKYYEELTTGGGKDGGK